MKNNKLLLLIFTVFFSLSFNGNAQFPGCPSVDAGPDQTLDCSTTCVDLVATPFEVGATNTYRVDPIPHAPPVPYNQSGGTAVSVGTDDVWSPQINLPFDFCFYGQTYNSAKIGSNGAIYLGPTTATYHPYSFTASVPSPDLNLMGNIFGVYHDMNPAYGGTIKYHLLGAAPCRVLVVIFNEVPHFQCTNLKSTSMIVLYETTNVIDVYVQKKETCNSWRDGRAVIGIQNPNGTQGIAAPGRNTGNWTVTSSSPEAYRFSPDGAPIFTTEWLQGGTVIGTGTNINVCASSPTTYTARTTYTPCTGGNTIVVEDDVHIIPNPDAPILTEVAVTSANCSAADGGFEVSASNGSGNYQYSIDNGLTFQAGGIFTNLTSGPYDVLVKDDNDCEGALTVTVTENNPVVFTADSTNISCHGEVDGRITLGASGGSTPYMYSLNGGTPQGNPVFSNLTAGTYQVSVTDGNGCVQNSSIEVLEPGEMELSATSVTNASCYGLNDGSIATTVTGGFPKYTYTISGPAPQNGPTFSNLPAGQYQIIVKDMNRCSDTIVQAITQPAAPITEISTTDTEYCTVGSTHITKTGVASGTFSSTPSGLVMSANTGTINLGSSTPGVYDIVYSFTENGCPYTDTLEIEVLEAPEINLPDSITLCLGESWIPNATGADTYIWTGGVNQGDTVLGVLGSTTYTVTGTGANGCEATASVVVSTYNMPDVSFTADPIEGLPPLHVTFENTSSGADDYYWTYGDGATDQNNNIFTSHSFQNVGEYQTYLIGLTDDGCADTAVVVINVLFPDMIYEFPNVFTPNVDNQNDEFKLINPENIQSLEIQILNRWGNLVFESNDVFFKWNGKRFNTGTECNDGTYFYKATLTNLYGEEKEEHGFVQLSIGN